ncbi:MAG: PIG-L family deacetylase [Acidobacteria bacterium]|nr:PIG-L family deacetylase [Acidobacteriota bacterium]
MPFHLPSAEVFVPDGSSLEEALARTTHLAVGAHQDDLEIMACHGILACEGRPDRWFTGAVLTDGGGSARSGPYADHSDAQMRALRREEQKAAARLGGFSACVLLDHPSSAVKDPSEAHPLEDLSALFEATAPEVVYTHNLADSHDTHVAVALRVIAALQALPRERRPARLLGCEVWRDLDWLPAGDKVALDVSGREDFQAALLQVFHSQVAGGKRYDLATLGRRRAHATFHESHETDAATGLTFAMDLSPLIHHDGLDPKAFVLELIGRFSMDVAGRLERLGGRA